MSIDRPQQNRLETEPPSLRAPQGSCPLWNGFGRTPVGFFLLEDVIHWYGTHYIDGRARPCTRTVGRCAPCEEGWIARRIGYICGMRGGTGGRYILRVTEYAFRHCPLMKWKSTLLGVGVVFSRRAETQHSPWIITVEGPAKRPAELPPSVDTVGVLSRIWGIDLNRLAACPPQDGDVSPLLKPYKEARRRLPQ